MKLLAILFLTNVITSLSVYAQQNISAVTMEINGNRNLQVLVDGKVFNLTNSSTTGTKTGISFNNLGLGQHTIQVIRTEVIPGVKETIPVLFNLRYGFDMLIIVNENGSLELTETKKTMVYENPPMNNTDFNNLLKNVRAQATVNGRRSVIANAFNNTNNYFTTFQVEQLLQLVNSESYRLQLAKLSYRGITDPDNFSQLYDLFTTQASKNELEEYVNSYREPINQQPQMADADFNTLYQGIKNQQYVSTQMNSLTNAFNNTSYHFTSNQASRLIQIVYSESNRLQLAKLSYRSIVDTANFSQVINLLGTQASKNELTAYVRNFNIKFVRTPMSDAVFNVLYQDIRNQRTLSLQMASLTNVFSDTSNYFTTYQAGQFIQIVTAESNRLQLAKLSYRGIVDTANFIQVYNLLITQASKDELKAYVMNYNKPGSGPKTAMADADFNSLYQTIQLQFFPGEKMSSITASFNNTSNYFTSAQAKKLIQLVSLESNRLQLAKLSYRTITDRNNFTQLYDLFSSQASKNDLDAYVKAYKD
jgi:Domain of unknown function (DUF4476)